ncbi:MAG: hypothetical protein U0694_22900 [Anaerolineae bacterium]
MVNGFQRIIANLNQLPLFTFEWHLLQRRTAAPQGWRRWINLLLGWSVLLLSIVLYLSELLRALLGGDLNIVPYAARWLMGIYALLALLVYTTPMRRAQTLAAQIIARDKSKPENWELLLLTGVDARSYVRSKWWLLLRAMLPALLYAGIVRAGAVTFLVAEFTRSLAANSARFSVITFVPPSALNILVLGLLSILMPYVGALNSAALSLDNVLDSRRNGNSWWGAFMRGAVIISGTSVIFLCGVFSVTILGAVMRDSMLTLLIALWSLTVLDNGFTVSGLLAAYAYSYNRLPMDSFSQLDFRHVLLLVVAALPFILLSAWFWLKMAEWTVRRYGLVGARP